MTTKAELQRQALQLPPAERVELVVDLWDSIGPSDIPVPEFHREIIRERLAELDGQEPAGRSTP